MKGRSTGSAAGLGALLAGAGVAHFLSPGFFDRIVPRVLPGSPRTWTLLSGAVELGCAAAVTAPRSRRAGALATAALFVLVFPANVQMAIDVRDGSFLAQILAYGRLPLQLPLVWWAYRVSDTNRPAV